MPKLKISNGITMYYEQHGQGPDLLLISGLSADHNAWLPVLETLAKKYRVTIFDNRGAGQTDAPNGPYSIELMVQDTVALMDALSIPRAHMVGHSMGGMILQQLCLDYPGKVNKAIMNASAAIIPSHAMAHIMSTIKLWEANAPLDVMIETVLPWLYADVFFDNPPKLAEAIDLIMNNPYPQSLTGFKAQVAACHATHLPKVISAITAPTLMIAGQEDVLLPLHCSEFLCQAIPGSQLAIIPDCAHMVQIEQPKAFCGAVTEFL